MDENEIALMAKALRLCLIHISETRELSPRQGASMRMLLDALQEIFVRHGGNDQ